MESKEDNGVDGGTLSMDLCEKKSTLHKTMTQEERQLLHPLEINDKLAFDTIKTVRLEFLTDEATSPIQRCQDLPSHAFSRLTGRAILVSLSHGWFFQAHPDPYGEKLDMFKNVFAPRLRKRYPHTDIQVFYDYLASPQQPRTDDEEEVFLVAMETMNSMYVYADVVLFLEIEPPSVDMTVHAATIDMSEYTLFDFIDTVQVCDTTSETGPQEYGSILTCGSLKLNDDRGWLFLERITTAIKAAAADKSCFDDIVVSNSEKLRTKILIWTEQLRQASKKPRKLRDLLEDFDKELQSKIFAYKLDESVVQMLMTKLIDQFCKNWKGEMQKQSTMSKRAREILLRWGCFSEDYVERAELLCDSKNDRKSWILLCVIVGLMAPAVAVTPFLIALEEDEQDPSRDRLFVSSVWLGCILG